MGWWTDCGCGPDECKDYTDDFSSSSSLWSEQTALSVFSRDTTNNNMKAAFNSGAGTTYEVVWKKCNTYDRATDTLTIEATVSDFGASSTVARQFGIGIGKTTDAWTCYLVCNPISNNFICSRGFISAESQTISVAVGTSHALKIVAAPAGSNRVNFDWYIDGVIQRSDSNITPYTTQWDYVGLFFRKVSISSPADGTVAARWDDWSQSIT